MTIKVILIDDHSNVHLGLSALLSVHEDIDLVAHGNNGEDAIKLCSLHKPDIVIMDMIMPKMNGIEATRIIHSQFPNIIVLALSSFYDDEGVRAMLQAGASGYILKSSDSKDMVETIRMIYKGKSVFSAEVTATLLRQTLAPSLNNYKLTQREYDVLRLMVLGKSNSEIATALVISLSTVKFHVSSLITKLSVSNRVEVVALAVEKRLVAH